MRVRPSSLPIAEVCERAPWLAHRYHERNPATERGHAVDAQISIVLGGGELPDDRSARALLMWVKKRFPGATQIYSQRRVKLIDPNTLEVLSEGTPDLLAVVENDGKRCLYVIDWKSKGQFWAGHLREPDDNLQQLTYMVAAGMELAVDEARIILALFDDDDVTPLESAVYAIDVWEPIIERVKTIPTFDPHGTEPEANKGAHCDGCYQRMHCSAYLLPATLKRVPIELKPFAEEGGGITSAQARDGIEWLERARDAMKRAKALTELVEEQLRTFATVNGPIRDGDREWGPMPTPGKRSGATVRELEEMGLTNLIKPGKPGVKFEWRPIKGLPTDEGAPPEK